MGGHPYWYTVPYQESLQKALDDLREREFKAGRYNPVVPFLNFEDPDFLNLHPGAKHKTIQDALNASDADGTRSILDIERVSWQPDYGVAAMIPKEKLLELFGTEKPNREMVFGNMVFFEDVERGKCVYIVIYKNEEPHEIFFGGYSYD
jgi:hypothetical protein